MHIRIGLLLIAAGIFCFCLVAKFGGFVLVEITPEDLLFILKIAGLAFLISGIAIVGEQLRSG